MIIFGKDGQSHINIYSKGETELGRYLSNFSYSPFEIDGLSFASVEAYWYWLSRKDDRLRFLHGIEAKLLGKTLPILERQENFEKLICKALDIKLKLNKEMFLKFGESDLPFAHYYVYENKRIDAGYNWILKHFEKRRTQVKKYIYNDN